MKKLYFLLVALMVAMTANAGVYYVKVRTSKTNWNFDNEIHTTNDYYAWDASELGDYVRFKIWDGTKDTYLKSQSGNYAYAKNQWVTVSTSTGDSEPSIMIPSGTDKVYVDFITYKVFFAEAGVDPFDTTDPGSSTDPDDSVVTAGKTYCYFSNTANWNNLKAWIWNDFTNYTGDNWPGVDLTEKVDDLYFWSTTKAGTPTGIIISQNGDDSKRFEVGFKNGAVYDATGKIIEYKAYPAAAAPTAISLDKESATIGVDGTVTLVATLAPAGAEGTITWSTSNAAVATVANGTVTGKTVGEATITATCGSLTATCAVSVVAPTTYTVHFDKGTLGWYSIYCYAYDVDPVCGAWPGKLMDYDGGTNYSVSFESVVAPTKVIFNTGEGQQTSAEGFEFENGAYYNFDGKVGADPEKYVSVIGAFNSWDRGANKVAVDPETNCATIVINGYVNDVEGQGKGIKIVYEGNWYTTEADIVNGEWTSKLYNAEANIDLAAADGKDVTIVFATDTLTACISWETEKYYVFGNLDLNGKVDWTTVNAHLFNDTKSKTVAMTLYKSGVYEFNEVLDFYPTGVVFNNGQWGGANQTVDAEFKANHTYTIKGQYLEEGNDDYGKWLLDKSKGTTGVDEIEAADAAAVYYNLQGVRVAEPTNGLYIVVRGNKVAKEIVR